MIKTQRLKHEFVEFIPEVLEPSKIYVSMEFATATHRCCCGCGYEVVTPFSPKDWTMSFDGETISLSTSIGNRKFPCRSQYFIRRGRVVEALSWDDGPQSSPSKEMSDEQPSNPRQVGVLRRLWRKFFS